MKSALSLFALLVLLVSPEAIAQPDPLPSWNDGAAKRDLEKIAIATLSGMTVEEFTAEVKRWIAGAKDARWKKPYTQPTYQPMLEVMNDWNRIFSFEEARAPKVGTVKP